MEREIYVTKRRKAKREITPAITAAICGDVVRHGKKYKTIEELFKKQKTAECFGMTLEEVIQVYEDCRENGRLDSIKRFICNDEGSLTKPYRGGRKSRNHIVACDWNGEL